MPLTRPFKETVMERLRSSAGFREAMLNEAVNCLLGDELKIGKSVLRDYINATLGFEELSKMVDIPPKSLMRMFGPNGNPQASNLFAVIAALQRHAGVELHVKNVSAAKAKHPGGARQARIKGRKEQYPPDKTGRYVEQTFEARAEFEEGGRKFRRK